MKKEPSITSFEQYLKESREANDEWAARRLFMPVYRNFRESLEGAYPTIYLKLKKILNNQ